MPSEAISLALAASIYPPALAVVIALGRGSEVRRRVVVFTLAAYLTALGTGVLMLFLFSKAGATSGLAHSPPAALYVLAGTALLWLALHLRRKPQTPPGTEGGVSRTDRYLGSRSRVMVLGLILYVIPSPIYIAAVKVIADTNAAWSVELAYIVLMLLLMLWMIELPTLMLIAVPQRSVAILESAASWAAKRSRKLAVLAAAVGGCYLLLVGLGGLLA